MGLHGEAHDTTCHRCIVVFSSGMVKESSNPLTTENRKKKQSWVASSSMAVCVIEPLCNNLTNAKNPLSLGRPAAESPLSILARLLGGAEP